MVLLFHPFDLKALLEVLGEKGKIIIIIIIIIIVIISQNNPRWYHTRQLFLQLLMESKMY